MVEMREIPLCPTTSLLQSTAPFSALHSIGDRAMALHRLCPLAVGGVPVAALLFVLFVLFASFAALALLLALVWSSNRARARASAIRPKRQKYSVAFY